MGVLDVIGVHSATDVPASTTRTARAFVHDRSAIAVRCPGTFERSRRNAAARRKHLPNR
jgi:hypothetical protein